MLTGISAILTAILPILNKIIPDPDKRLETQAALEKALMESQDKIYDSMKDVMVADSQSESAYTRYARPTVLYWSLGIISLVVVLAPFGFDHSILEALTTVPSKLWDLMTVSFGGFIIGRSAEKAVNNYRK